LDPGHGNDTPEEDESGDENDDDDDNEDSENQENDKNGSIGLVWVSHSSLEATVLIIVVPEPR